MDPLRINFNPAKPQSWSRYSYTEDDPVNFLDPLSLYKQGDVIYREEQEGGGDVALVWSDATPDTDEGGDYTGTDVQIVTYGITTDENGNENKKARITVTKRLFDCY